MPDLYDSKILSSIVHNGHKFKVVRVSRYIVMRALCFSNTRIESAWTEVAEFESEAGADSFVLELCDKIDNENETQEG